MAKYKAHRKTWLSHENRLVQEGEEFETEFPEGMKLSDNLECLDKPKRKSAPKQEKPAKTEETGTGEGEAEDGEGKGEGEGEGEGGETDLEQGGA